MAWLFWQRLNKAFQLSLDIKGKSVLDFGCGAGVSFKYFAENQCQIVGCDNKSHELAQQTCKEFGIDAEITQDLFSIHGKKFDIIFALDVLEHIEDLEPFIKKFKELSHPDTQIILSGPTENLLYKIGKKWAGSVGHYHVHNIYDIEKVFKKLGLKMVKKHSLYFPFTLFRVSSWVIDTSPNNTIDA